MCKQNSYRHLNIRLWRIHSNICKRFSYQLSVAKKAWFCTCTLLHVSVVFDLTNLCDSKEKKTLNSVQFTEEKIHIRVCTKKSQVACYEPILLLDVKIQTKNRATYWIYENLSTLFTYSRIHSLRTKYSARIVCTASFYFLYVTKIDNIFIQNLASVQPVAFVVWNKKLGNVKLIFEFGKSNITKLVWCSFGFYPTKSKYSSKKW